MRGWLLVITLSASFNNFAQVILTEVMYDASGPEASDEFIEIYNTGNAPANLSGWQIGDGASFDFLEEVETNGLILQPEQYGIILDPDYFSDSSATYNSVIPPDALVLTIGGSTFGSGGLSNSTAENVVLVSASGDTLQFYTYSLGNSPGFSDEKIELTGNNSPQNWGDSRNLNGTPGARNSLTRAEVDLGISDFQLSGGSFIVGANIPFQAVVKNLGRQIVGQFVWQTFYDRNENGLADPEEILEAFQSTTSLAADDSIVLEGEFLEIPFGEVNFALAILLAGDEDTTNNVAIQAVYVEDPGGEKIVINEILANPRPGEEEWVEFYNNGSRAINLRNLFFADAGDTIEISAVDRFIEPGEFFILAGDSNAAFQYSLPFDKMIINSRFPTLNNDVDDLRILGPSKLTYDRVFYNSGWYGRETAAGVSLEKINPSFNGQIAQNWGASVASLGSTPAAENSIFVQVLPPENQLEIIPNPFSPDGDGVEDFTIIQFKFGVETAFINIRIFDTRGRLIRHLANGEAAAHQGQLVWDGKDDAGKVARIGAYICLVQALNAGRQVQAELKKAIILIKK